jgi:TonB family protein
MNTECARPQRARVSRLYLMILSLMLVTGCRTSIGDVKIIDRSGSGGVTPSGIESNTGSSDVRVIDHSGGKVTASGIEIILVKKVMPSYPADAKNAGLQGVVKVQFIVRPDGSVSDLIVVQSAHPVLDQLVLDAVAQWKFEPYSPRLRKLVKAQVPVEFSISRTRR